jgi:hypothetical protein
MGDVLKVDHSVSISGLKSVGQVGCIKSYRLSANGWKECWTSEEAGNGEKPYAVLRR